MYKLLEILEDLGKDLDKDSKIQTIIEEIKQLVSSYRGKNTNNISVRMINGRVRSVTIVPPSTKTSTKKPLTVLINNGGFSLYNAEFSRSDNVVAVNLYMFTEDKVIWDPKKKSLYLNFSDDVILRLRHELTHYLDYNFEFSKHSKDKAFDKAANTPGGIEYLTSPVEYNAFYFHHVMPSVEKILSGAVKLGTFKEFYDLIWSDDIFKSYIRFIRQDKEFHQRFMKRLGSYYIQLNQILNQKGKLDKKDVETVLKQAA